MNDTENTKLKLHIRYILFISVLVVSALFLAGCFLWPYNDEITQKFSFAGTVSSIILSVLAIIVTLVGEGNIDSIRQRIDSSTSDLKTVTDQIKENNGNL